MSWSDAEVKAFICVWMEANIQQELDGDVRNKDWIQCRAKVKNLKTSCKKVKDNNDRSGRARKPCQYFEQLDTILGS